MTEYQLKNKLIELFAERAEANKNGFSATEYTLDKEIEQIRQQLNNMKEEQRKATNTAFAWYIKQN